MSDSETEADSYPEWYHPDHRVKDRAPQPISELQGPTRWTPSQSVVKLVFFKAGKESVGSGFIVRLPPDAVPQAGELVILTAAHNLATPTHERTTNLRVYFSSGTEVTVDESQTHFCQDYSPNSGPDSDYGFIRVPTPTNDPTSAEWGFGFSLQFAYFPPAFVRQLHITGYTPSGSLQSMIGPPLGFRENEVEYDMETEQGISGSAVWLVYERAPFVVAIHNNGKKKEQPNRGSRGAPITVKLLQTLYEWLKNPQSLIVQNKKLKAVGTPKKPASPDGLFLSFSAPLGRVKLGTGSSFDRVLVQSIPEEKTYPFVYALRQYDKGKKWVQFNMKTKQVLLDDKLGRDCFTWWEPKKNGNVVRVGLSPQTTSDWRRLQLGGKYVTKNRETLEVFLTDDGDKNSFPFLELA